MKDKLISYSWHPEPLPPATSVWVSSAGRLEGGGHSRYHWKPDYFCPHIIIKGEGLVKIPNMNIPVTAGDMFTIWPGVEIEYAENPAHPWTFSWLHLDGSGAGDYAKELGFNKKIPVIKPHSPEQCLEIFEKIRNMCEKKENGTGFLLISELYKLLFFAALHEKKQQQERDLAAEALALINSPEGIRENVTEICRALHISRVTLFRIFKEKMSTSPINYINKRRIDEAQALLSGTRLKISETAALCGFNSVEYFQRRFKECTGKTPDRFRKNT